MRNKRLILGGVAVALLAGTGLALAGGRGDWGGPHAMMGPMGGPMGGMRTLIIERIDTNKDGKITKEEIAAFDGDSLKKYDANGDGALSLDEFDAFFRDLTRPVTVRAFQFVDKDGDAKVTLDEFSLPGDRLVKALDRNGDGTLDANELNPRWMGRRGPGPGPAPDPKDD
jgi:hypothetical protein